MHAFAGLDAVHETLEGLIHGPALRHERRPGQKEERYAQLLGDESARRDLPDALRGAPGPHTRVAILVAANVCTAGRPRKQLLEPRAAGRAARAGSRRAARRALRAQSQR